MTKCNFCYDNLDAGLNPACVAACPMRVLDFVTVDDGQQTINDGQSSVVYGQKLWELPATEHPFPLPEFSRTEPRLAIKPHAGMVNGLEKNIYNQEEVKPQRHSDLDELPLVIFTLCAQMAAGMAVFSLFGGPLTPALLAVIGGLIGIGGLASFLHLGTPLNAWRAVNHLRKSWLSREILMLSLFGASWLFALFLPGMGNFPLALTGIGLVYSMAQVYRIKAVPAWNTWRTGATFFLSAVILGGLALPMLDALTGTGIGAGASLPFYFAGIGLIAALGLSLSDRQTAHQTARRLRVAATGLALAGLAAAYGFPPASHLLIPFVFLAAILGEFLGRWLFYASRNPDL
jgi:anaerobic dimethyl sulfoxide reductase subunit C (anchor subunit)